MTRAEYYPLSRLKAGNVQLALDPHSFVLCYRSKPVYRVRQPLLLRRRVIRIAKLVAKIAVGLTLDAEVINPVTGSTYAMFELALTTSRKFHVSHLDKFEKGELSSWNLWMKATGEVMAIGRNIESLLKACRSLEIGVPHHNVKCLNCGNCF